jgi:hypothetical protein
MRTIGFVLAVLLVGGSIARAQNSATNKPAATATNAPANRLSAEQRKQIGDLLKAVKTAFDEKKYADAKAKLLELLKIQPDAVEHWYNLACAQSRLGEKKDAIQSLETAAEKGWADFLHLERDADLDAIRGEPGYKKLIARKDELQKARAKKIHEQLVKQYGKDCLYHIDDKHRLVYATTVDQRTLEELRETLEGYAEALSKELFKFQQERYVTIVVPKTWNGGMIGGLYNDQSAALISRGVGDEMIHEFTHALHHGDQHGRDQEHPIWLTEGLASLYEDSEIEDGKAVPHHNYRLNHIYNRVRVNRQVEWSKFMAMKQPDFLKTPLYSYAQARYMMFYLHEQGKLSTWYQRYVTGYASDTNGVAAWETTFGRKLPEIEKDWAAWIQTLSRVPIRLKEGDPSLGLSLQQGPEGLTVTRIGAESLAGKSGLKTKDLITRVAGTRVVSGLDLVDILAKQKVGDSVTIEYRRGTEYQETKVQLIATPSPYRQKPPAKPKTEPAKDADKGKPAS